MLKINSILIFVFIALTNVIFAQNTSLKGRISSTSDNIGEIVVYNLSQNKVTLSREDGTFEIEASEGDLLTFQAVHLDYWRQSVKKSDFENGMSIKMTEKSNTLEEIEIINYPKINAQDLGIIDYTPKKYTPAERRLRPAIFNFKDIVSTTWGGFLMGGLGLSVPIDPLLYWLTGETKKLKTNLKIEQKQLLMEDLLLTFDERYFVDELKINKDYISAFLFFVAEDYDFVKAYQLKDYTVIKWHLAQLSTQFKILTENE